MRPVGRLRTAVSWRVKTLGWRRTVRVRRQDLDLRLNLRDNAQRALHRNGAYEPNLRDRILGELEAGDVYMDIGAHIGIHALTVARRLEQLGGGHVYAFEPTESADRLAEAARRNTIQNLTLIRAAVGDVNGHLELKTDPDFGPDDPGVRSAYGPGKSVGHFPILRVDDWAADAGLDRLDVVKLDIEGGEFAALRGMRATLARLKPRLVVVEESDIALNRAGVTVEQLYDELARSGYRPADRLVDHDSTVVNVTFSRLA